MGARQRSEIMMVMSFLSHRSLCIFSRVNCGSKRSICEFSMRKSWMSILDTYFVSKQYVTFFLFLKFVGIINFNTNEYIGWWQIRCSTLHRLLKILEISRLSVISHEQIHQVVWFLEYSLSATFINIPQIQQKYKEPNFLS